MSSLVSLLLKRSPSSSRPSRGCNVFSRRFSSSLPRLCSSDLLRSTGPSEERQDVTVIDQLMNVVRQRSNPHHRSVIPVRVSQLWSKTISSLSTSTPTATAPPSAATATAYPPPTRRMHESYTELILAFASEPDLLDQYTNASGGLRIGKLMENLDSLAGSIAYKHVLGPEVRILGGVLDKGFFIVTAAVDRLDMLKALTPGNISDLRLCGHVIYAGRSSMEIVVKMELVGVRDETVMLGRFSMVCRDGITQKAKSVPGLALSTPEEQTLSAMGAAFKQRKKSLSLHSLDRVPPTRDDVAQLHELFLRHGQNDGLNNHIERVWMEDTALENCLLMFPQERNIHSKIFGGYLMRLAYELSFATTSLFSRRALRFLSLDGLSFSHPVPIGSILRLRSHVACIGSNPKFPLLAHATVNARVVDIESGKELTTNDFRFTWCDDHGPALGRTVVPKTYQEAMEWIEAKRALEAGDEIRKLMAS
ncbi:HotDog domain-containing protein [Gautieria morchelliformis]|nr:HotDog domain-containing protein [Gautieria morchelliformis]